MTNHTHHRMLARHAPVRRYRRKDKDMSITDDLQQCTINDLTLEIGKLNATVASVARQRDAAKAEVARLVREDNERRAAIAGIKGHWGLLAIAQLDWTRAVEDLGGWLEVGQFVAEMAHKEGFHDANACAEKYQVEVVF